MHKKQWWRRGAGSVVAHLTSLFMHRSYHSAIFKYVYRILRNKRPLRFMIVNYKKNENKENKCHKMLETFLSNLAEYGTKNRLKREDMQCVD